MATPLWTWNDLVAASRGTADGPPATAIDGISIDSRAIQTGDLFVALKDQRDGHDFVAAAFTNGAAAALVATTYSRRPGDGPLLRVPDTLAALQQIGRAARARLSPEARVVAVTGSAGKTGTKEMLRVCLSSLGLTHAPEKSFNNHWGVPLTLARMPADVAFGVFEIGMNHAGEITPLSRLVRPHVAIVTTVEAVHLGHFGSVEEIADAKAEIFDGLEPGGIAVLNRDNQHYDRLRRRALSTGAHVLSFGTLKDADIRPASLMLGPDHTDLQADCFGGRLTYRIAAPGQHIAMNSLAVVAAVEALGADFEGSIHAMSALAGFHAPAGRGAREQLTGPLGRILLIDESYNANPASMRAALSTLSLVPRETFPRRIAVLGDMLELGARADELHAALDRAIDDAGLDLVFAAGQHMKCLFDRLDPALRGHWAPASDQLVPALLAAVRDGDAIVVKGSLGSRMAPLIAALRSHIGGKAS